jgi:signal transduction histidine kinase
MRWGLRGRFTLALLGYLAIVTVVVFIHGYVVNERAEALVWESLLRTELTHFVERRAADPDLAWTDTETFQLYGPLSARAVPPEFAELPPGIHDEVFTATGEYIVFVTDSADGRSVMTLEISGLERAERTLMITLGLSTGVIMALLAIVGYFGAGWLVKPLADIATTVASFAPNRKDQRLPLNDSAPYEAKVITDAFNEYLQRLDQFLERERSFLNMASHELRTPIAVIASSVEVEMDRRGTRDDPFLMHVLTTARDMERLVSMLLALAKDPARLRGADEIIELAQLIPSIVADHAFLAKHKELSFAIDLEPSVKVAAPPLVARAAIGNLLRNAIENSDRGVIRIVSSKDAKVVIADPGHGMSEAEMSAVYTRLARSGEAVKGTGIGLELIARLCEHLGWRLAFSSERNRGTTATLDFGARAA